MQELFSKHIVYTKMPKRSYGRKGKLTPYKVMKSVKRLKRDLQPMIDYLDITGDAVNITNGGSIVSLSPITSRIDGEEADRGKRDGDTVQIKNLLIRGAIKWSTNEPNVAVRLIILMKKQDNDQAVTVQGTTDSDVLQEFTVGDTLDVLAPLSWHARTGFKILSDDLLIGNPDSIDNLVFKKYFKFNHQAKYTANNGMARGNLYMLLKSDQADANYPTIHYYSRLKYTQNL